MMWGTAQIAKMCLQTRMRDPRRNPQKPFLYVDISAIDRGRKVITSAPEILGADAPSRARKEICEGDVLVSTVRPNLNAVAVVPPDLDEQIASTGFCVLRPKSADLVGKYLFYFTTTPNFVGILSSKVRGAHYPAVSDGDVKEIELPLPTLSEQRRIVEILDQADALRRKRAEADTKAARILPALFYEIFGDPTTNPKGWPTEKLGDLFDVVGGGTPSKSVPEYWTGEVLWVSPKDMKCDVVLDTEDHITPDAINNSATRLVKQGSVLVVYRSGILAHSFPVAIAGRDLTINQDLKALWSKGQVSNEYLYGLLGAAPTLGRSCVKKGATVHNVDGARFLSLEIAKPPERLQEWFAFQLKALLQHKVMRQSSVTKLEQLSSVLLHRAFTGDLTIRWREAHMKELLAEMEQRAKALEAGQ